MTRKGRSQLIVVGLGSSTDELVEPLEGCLFLFGLQRSCRPKTNIKTCELVAVREAARAGWDVAFTYSKHAKVEASGQKLGRKVKGYTLDVRDSAAVDRVSEQVLNDFDGVRAVICNAGVSLNGLAYSVSDEDWRTVIDTNLTGSFYVCRAFLPELVSRRFGRILFVSSVTSFGASGQAAYAASKSGLHGLAMTLAKEYGPKGITANVVAPGYFDTDMTREMPESLSSFILTYCPARRAH